MADNTSIERAKK